MAIHLAGDIGGTKTIVRLVHADKTAVQTGQPELTTLHGHTYASQNFPDLMPNALTRWQLSRLW